MRSRTTFYFLTSILLIFCVLSCKNDKKDSSGRGESGNAVIEPEIEGSELIYTSDTLKMKGYLAYDRNRKGTRPGILVVHEWWGHNDYVRERSNMLAGLGYTALAVDMYGDGKQANHPEDAGKFASAVMSNFEGARARFEAAMEVLKEHPTVDSERIGAMGYCFGGSVVLSMANAGVDLDGVASFHGGLGLPVMPTDSMKVKKILVCNGADDNFVSAEQIAAFKDAMEDAETPLVFRNYPGAVHGFTSKHADNLGAKFGMALAYNQEADSLSWIEAKKLFIEVFN